MSRSPLRPATATHTNKLPSECPYCGSHVISRKGVRKKKLEVVQIWRCAACKRTFTPGPAAARNKTYPIRFILQALNEIERNDAAHNGTMQRMFGIEWTDPALYAIVLNTARIPVEDCVGYLVRVAQSPAFAETEQSRMALMNRLISTRVSLAKPVASGGKVLDLVLERRLKPRAYAVIRQDSRIAFIFTP